MPVRLCNRCGTKLPAEVSTCACGGAGIDYLEPDEAVQKSEENLASMRGRDIGAAVGAFVTQGNTIGAVVGYTVGKKIEEALDGKNVVTFKAPVPDAPPRDLGVEAARALDEQRKKVQSRIVEGARKIRKKLRRKP